MLASLVTYNSLVNDIYIEVTSDIKSQIHILHLEKCFMQQRQEINFQHLC